MYDFFFDLGTSCENAKFPFSYNGTKIKITVSIGVSEVNKQTESVHQLFENADKALYKAKENGRNQISLL